MLTLSQNLTLDFSARATDGHSQHRLGDDGDRSDHVVRPHRRERRSSPTRRSDGCRRSIGRSRTSRCSRQRCPTPGRVFPVRGVNNRLNNIQIDGASENDLFGLGDTGQPGGQARGKSIGLESVREYQVLLAPFDVRQGNFGGVLVNAVTRGGTNELHGTAFFSARSEGLARNVDYVRDQEYRQTQFGFSVGGPILHDRVQFFVAPEFQRRFEPAAGPYLGQKSQPFPASSVGHRPLSLAAWRLRHRCRVRRPGEQRESAAQHLRARRHCAEREQPARAAPQLRIGRGRRTRARPDADPPNVERPRVHVGEGKHGRAAVHELRWRWRQRADRRLQPHSRSPPRRSRCATGRR